MNTALSDGVATPAPDREDAGLAESRPLSADSTSQPAIVPAGFDAGKAVRFSVANVGAQGIYALFNQSMPMYLQAYGLDPAWIGLLANERSFVGSLVQPFIGRLSDRTRTPFGRRRPFFLVGVAQGVGIIIFSVSASLLWEQ
jgi:MFS family permease